MVRLGCKDTFFLKRQVIKPTLFFWYQNLDADVAAYLKNGIILQATIRLMPPELQTKWYQKNLK